MVAIGMPHNIDGGRQSCLDKRTRYFRVRASVVHEGYQRHTTNITNREAVAKIVPFIGQRHEVADSPSHIAPPLKRGSWPLLFLPAYAHSAIERVR